jgi:TPR repeat protein
MIITRFYKLFIGITFILMPIYIFADEIIKDALDGEPHAQYLLGKGLLGDNDSSGLVHILIASTQGHLKSILLLESLNKSKPELDNYRTLLSSQCKYISIVGELSEVKKKELRNNGNTGDVTTQFCMWIYYVNNLGIQKPEAYTWLKQAAGNNHPEALLGLGLLYHYGYIVPEEKLKAIRLFNKSKELGFDLSDGLLKAL